MRVCSTTHCYHYFFDHAPEKIQSVLDIGLRPLSYFPDSPRWKQLHEAIPEFYKNLYTMIAEPILQKPYDNSGVFITPIDFYKLPNTFLHDKPRACIPLERIQPDWTVVTHVLDEKRESLPFSLDTMKTIADTWTEAMVRQWFGKDQSKVFYYVPQLAVYQPDGIPVTEADMQHPVTQ